MSKRIPDRQPVQNPRRENGQTADVSIVTGDYNDWKARLILKECAGEVTRNKNKYAAVLPPPPTAPENGRACLPNSRGGHGSSVDNGDNANENPGEESAKDRMRRSDPERPLVTKPPTQPPETAPEQHDMYLESPWKSIEGSDHIPNDNRPSHRAIDATREHPSLSVSTSLRRRPEKARLAIQKTVSDSPRLLPSNRRGPPTSARPNIGSTENNESRSERLERSDLSLTQPITCATAQGESKTQTAREAPPVSSGCVADVAMQSKSRGKCQDWRRERTELGNREGVVNSAVAFAASLTLGVVYWVVYSTSPA